jgi:hypothetical protein
VAAFLIDEDVAADVADILSAHGQDALTVSDLARRASKDDAILWLAARLHRTLLSHNAGDFVMLHRAWHRWRVDLSHAGILIVRQRLAWRPVDVAEVVLGFLSLNLATDGELYTLEPGLIWQRFDVSAAIVDTALL